MRRLALPSLTLRSALRESAYFMDVGACSRTGLRRDRRRSSAARGRKQQAVFALPALQVNSPVALDRLVDELWRDEPPAQATLSLQSHISRLRRTISHPQPEDQPAHQILIGNRWLSSVGDHR
jgi:DNA-binding SARP family transcriptional activator